MKKILILTLFCLPFLFINAQSQLVQAVVSIGGRVYNITNNQPLSVNIEIFDQNGQRINKIKSNATDGSYFITGLKPGTTYEIRFSDFDYMKYSYSIQIPATDKYVEYSKDFLIIPKKTQTKILIPVKLFETHKSKLKYGADLFLSDYINLLKLNPTVKIKIVSFPDDNANPQDNLALTQQRGSSLKDYFVSNGIDAQRISFEGNESTDPDNPPPTGRASKGKKYIGSTYLIIEGF